MLPVAALALTLAAPGAAGADPARAEVRLTVAGPLVAVSEGGRILVHDQTGRAITRLPSPPRDTQAGSHRVPGEPDREVDSPRERLWDRLGVPEEARESDAALDLADDELLRSERRPLQALVAPAAESGPPAPALAAAGDQRLFLLAAGALYQLGADGVPLPLGRAPRLARAMAASDQGRLFLASDQQILTASQEDWRFRLLARERGVSALVVHPGGGWVGWASDRGLTILDRSGRRWAHPGTSVRSLALCGGALAMLDDQGVAVTGPGLSVTRLAGPLPARQLACARDGQGPWLAVGPGLWASSDGGRTFRARRDAPAGEVLAAAVAADRLWLFGPSFGGLMPLALQEAPAPALIAGRDPFDPAMVVSAPRPTWLRLLPRVGLQASRFERQGHSELRALAFAELPLAPAPSPLVRRSPRLVAQASGPEAPMSSDPRAGWARDAACLPEARSAAARLGGADPARAESFVRRAGRSAWLPEVRLRLERRLGRSESLDLKPTSSADALGLDTDNDVRYEVRATWDLPRLVFHPEEVAAAHQALRMADMRREIESQVNRLYFERRRLVALGGDAIDEVERGIRLEEIGAELDAVSDGAWSRCLLHQGR